MNRLLHTKSTIVPQDFFARPVLHVAQDLLGKYLVSESGEGMITEVEAYDGPEDKACHGRFGRTQRTAPMFGPAGHWYVYLVYGMYQMLNAVTDSEGYPAAVLVRSVGQWNGPGKLTKAWGIDETFNAKRIQPSSGLWVEDRGTAVPSSSIQQLPRIGIDYAKEWKNVPYRFLLPHSNQSPQT